MTPDGGPAAPVELALAPVPRRAPPSPGQLERARYTARLREPLHRLEFVIAGRRLHRLAWPPEDPGATGPGSSGEGSPFESIVDLAWPQEAADALRWLAAVQDRDEGDWPLETGRLPLHVCSVCADLACGALTASVVHDVAAERVTWSEFRVEDGWSDPAELPDLGPFVFDRDAYRRVLLEPVGMLEEFDAREQVARAEHRRRSGLRGAVRRLLHR